MILDTNFIIDLMSGNDDATKKAAELDNRNEALFVTSISVFELWQGLGEDDKKESEDLIKLVKAFGLLDFDVESSKIAGQLHRKLRNKGKIIKIGDSMIAGICITHGHSILTKDEHFSRIKGLKIEIY